MLSSGRVMETMAKLKQQDKTLWEKICEFFKDLVEHLKAIVDAYGNLAPDSVEGRLVADMTDVIQTLESLYAEALVEASDSLTPGVEGTVVSENGDPVAHATADGSVQLSMRTYEEEGRSAFRAYLEKCVSSNRLTKAEMQEMMDGIEEIYQTCKEFKDKYAPFSTWSDAAVVTDTYGRPVFSVVTPNGDYKMNLDFSLVCKKRRSLDAVFNEMSKRGIIDNFELGQKSVVKINEIIRKHGFETACALCFVDAKRFRQASMADSFTSLYNELVYSLVPENQRGSIDHFNFGGYETIKKVDGGIDTWDASKLDFSHLDEVMKTYGSGTVEYKAAKYIKTHAEGRKLLLRGDFMSSKGFDAVKTQNKDILKLYNSKKGTGGPKAAFGDVQYLNEIIKKARTWTPAKAYAVGGVRIQSFSDYVPRMVFDYVQMIYDLAATKLPAHAYTKEALFVKQFGLTGIKINMSLIPAIAEGGIAAGLDANGDYVWAGESFDFETAKEIQNAEGYTENCGTICVGVSDLHIRKLLGDPDIRMVIPYHKSGLNPIVAHMNKIAKFTDYTGSQTTKDSNGKKVGKDFDFNAALHKMGTKGDPKAVIQQYLEWCDTNGYTPRFSQFRDHPNYYKLIEDFTLYDMNGQYVPQHEVRAVFPTADSAFGSMKDLIEVGLQEDAIIEGKRDKSLSAIVDEIESTLPKTEAEIAETEVQQADRDLEAEVNYSDRSYGGIRETLAKKGLDEMSKRYGSYFPLSASFDATMKADNTPLVMETVHANNVQRKRKESAYKVGRKAFISTYGTSTSVHIDQMGIDAKLYADVANESISKAIGQANEQSTLDVIPHIREILASSVLMGVERIVHTDNKGTALYGYRLYNLYWYSDGKTKTPHALACTVVQDLDKAEGYVFQNIENVTIDRGLPGIKTGMSSSVNDDTNTVAQLYTAVKKIARSNGGLRYTNDERNKYLFAYTERDDGVAYSDRDPAPVFYSQMAKVVEGVKQEKLGAASVVNMLRGKGVKAEEIKWSGIETWLEGKKSVTKAELQEFIAGSMLQIEEEQSGKATLVGEDGTIYDGETAFKDAAYAIADEQGIDRSRVKFVIDTEDTMEAYAYVGNPMNQILVAGISEAEGSSPRWGHYKLDGGENYREIVFKMPGSSYSNQAMRAHWGEDAQGVLAHARIQDFVNEFTGYKTLFIEEIQSDWHNAGHKGVYTEDTDYSKVLALRDRVEIARSAVSDAYTEYKRIEGELFDFSIKLIRYGADSDTLQKETADLQNKVVQAKLAHDHARHEYVTLSYELSSLAGKIPDAPFRNNYHEYVLKRLIRMAAEQGYDELAWTTAQIQSERWSEEYAEGYRIEYDQDIPKFLAKYGKKWGAKVGKTTLETGKTDADGNPRFGGGNYSVEVWSMEITDAMRDSVLMEGQPLYSDRDYVSYDRTAILKEETVDRWLSAYAARNPKYAQAYIGYIDPRAFLNMTTTFTGRRMIEDESTALDEERFAKATSAIPMFLDIETDTGKVTGHEGRHRSVALRDAGIDRVPILFFDYSNKYSKEPIESLLLRDQKYGAVTTRVYDLIPFSTGNRDEVVQKFATQSGHQKMGEKYGWSKTIRFQERAEDSVSNRSLLAGALETVAKNDVERRRIAEYQEKVELINAEERKLRALNEQIKELSFAKGPKDTKKIRDLQFEAKQTANRINTYDRQLLRLEASAPLQAVLDREKKAAYKRAEKKGKEALAAYRERAAKTQQELITRYQAERKRGVESRNKTAMRHKIKDVVNELNKLLLHGTKDKHVMIGLQKAVAEALDAVNMDTVGAAERVAKYNDLIAKATDPDVIASLTATRDRIQEQGDKLGDKLQRLKASYGDIKNSDDPLIANSYDEVIANRIETVTAMVGDTPLRAMTLEQLEAVYDMYKMVLTTIRNSNKAFKAAKNETISTLGNRVMEEVEEVGGSKPYSLKGVEGLKGFAWNGLKPVYAFKAIGSKTLSGAFDAVRAGEDTWAKDVTEAKDFYTQMARKYGYHGWNFKRQYSFTSTTGKQFNLSLEQILSLYAYSKRPQADLHLEKGGFVFDSSIEVVEKKNGIPVKYTVKTATAHNLSKDILAEITGTLTEAQKGFVDEMQTYLSETMGEKGNEVSLEMYGVKLFKEKAYFPLKSAKQFMFEQNEAAGEVRIKNAGFSKETVAFAANPIILSNFMDVWANHVNDMSMYHAFVLPLEDFNRIFNYKTPNVENLDTESVKMYLQNAYGTQPEKYIKQLLTDLNGGARTDSTTGIINKGIGAFKKGAVFASLSVVVQQPSAIARAFAYVDAKYFVGKRSMKKHEALWAEVKKYAPVAIIKEMGYFDTNMGMSTVDFITAREYSRWGEKMKALVTDSNYRDEILSKAPALADELTWASIWEAVKRETAAKHKGLQKGSEAFLQKAGERFTEVIVNTQVYDSVLSRSAMMRSKDTGMKMATAFMAEPTTTINMVADALIQGKRGNKKYARAAIGAAIASQILNSILVSFVYAGRDDDEEKSYWEKYLKSLTGEVKDSFNIFGYIPFVKDIVSIVQGYEVERSDMSVISDLWKAYEQLGSSNISTYRKVENFAGSIAQIFGLPVKNIMRDARAIYQTADSYMNGELTTKAGVVYAVKEGLTGETVKNQQQLYEAYLSGDKTQIARVEGRYEDQSAINSAIRKALRENDPRIHEAAVARMAGEIAEYTAIARAIIGEGFFSQDNVVAAINAEINAMDKGEDSGSASTKTLSLYKSEDFVAAILDGDEATANTVKNDIIQTAVANGKTQSDAEASFESSARSACKDEFLAGNLSEAKAIDTLVDFCGNTQEEAEKKVGEWAFEAEYGFAYSDRGTAYKNGAISADELIDILMDVGGKTYEDADLQVQVYDWQMEVPECDDITASAIEDYNSYCAPAGISKSDYYEAWTTYKDTPADYDDAGDSIPYSKTVKVMPYINSLPLSADQKTALALCWWSQATVNKYRLW